MNLINPIVDTVTNVIKSILPPEKMSEKERADIEAQTREKLLKADWKYLEVEMKDRANARALAMKDSEKGNVYTTLLAAIHRPLWSIVTLILFAWTIIAPSLGFPEVILQPVHQSIMQTIIIFYFGGRSVEKVFKTLATKKN
jgi:hypothetical protein